MNDRPAVRIEMLSDPVFLAGTREMIVSIARRLGFAQDAASQIALAVDEALCNVIRHGYDGATDRPITIGVWQTKENDGHDKGGIRIVIEDEARQVDPSRIQGRALDQVRPGGLGVHIMRQVMDEVVYENRTPKGMRLTMFKRMSPGDDGPECACAPAPEKEP